MNDDLWTPAAFRVDSDRAHPARVRDYLLGGKDNFAADREAGDKMIAQLPDLPVMARANRRFLFGAVRHLVAGCGVTQFLDIGSGLPTACPVHEAAQDIDPAACVVYVDQDEVVAAHSRALLTSTSTPAGRAAFIAADARMPHDILDDPILAETLDLGQPTGLMLVSVLMYWDDETAHKIVRTLLDALPSGSYLTISHPTADFDPDAAGRAVAAAEEAGLTYLMRSGGQVARFFSGLDLVGPGVVPMLDWHPGLGPQPKDSHSVYYWVGMARKP